MKAEAVFQPLYGFEPGIFNLVDLHTAVQIIRIWKWKQNSDENLVILEFKYLQNKKWYIDTSCKKC